MLAEDRIYSPQATLRTSPPLRDWLPFALLAALILFFSTDWFSGDRVYSFLQEDLVRRPIREDELIDRVYLPVRKAGHILAFVLLGLSVFPLKKRGRDGFGYGVLWCTVVAVASELVQLFSQYRLPSLLDVAVNLGASALGLRLLFAPPAFLKRAGPPAKGAWSRAWSRAR